MDTKKDIGQAALETLRYLKQAALDTFRELGQAALDTELDLRQAALDTGRSGDFKVSKGHRAGCLGYFQGIGASCHRP